MAVVDAVVAGQVARRLGRGHEVVGRDGVRAVRQRDFLDRRAQPFVDLQRGADRLLDLGVEALAEILAGHADGERLDRLLDRLACRAERAYRRWCCRGGRGRR